MRVLQALTTVLIMTSLAACTASPNVTPINLPPPSPTVLAIWKFASPPPTELPAEGCPDWLSEETPERAEALFEIAELLEDTPLDADGDLATSISACKCPPGRVDMTVGNLAARHRVCLFVEWVALENSRLWEAWAARERKAHKELGQ